MLLLSAHAFASFRPQSEHPPTHARFPPRPQAMEQQSISISKAGIVTSLQVCAARLPGLCRSIDLHAMS